MKFRQLPTWVKGGLWAQIFPISLFILLKLGSGFVVVILTSTPLMLIEFIIEGSTPTELFFKSCDVFLCMPNISGWLILITVYFILGVVLVYILKLFLFIFKKMKKA